MRRILIAGTNSGCGKTTITCAILAALKKRGSRVSSFKCGPDYIDPMFHREIIGVPSYNLDSFFCDDATLKYLMYEHSSDSDISVVEGVMGFYDGEERGTSSHSLSLMTNTPAVIVIDCKGMSDSVGAVMRGFLEYKRPNNIAGFIFNRLSDKLTGLAQKLCSDLGTQYLGYFPKSAITLESRHLGLVTASETDNIKEKLGKLGETAEKCIAIDSIMSIPEREFPAFTAPSFPKKDGEGPVIAVARDNAFCFIYEDNIELLKKLGCEICFFSPLSDRKMPENAAGLLLCGGYPELYAAQLSANKEMLADIRGKLHSGLPVIAECGGFMYLHDTFEDMDNREHTGVGAVRGKAFRTEKLQRFGYVTMTAENDNLICKAGEKIRAHEFHYFDSTNCGNCFVAAGTYGRTWECVHADDHFYAGFPHLYFYADMRIAERFVNACRCYMENKTDDRN